MNSLRNNTLVMVICCSFTAVACAQDTSEWMPIFNGSDLSGWTPKFAGSEYGNNLRDTFRVEDGLLRVSYDRYPNFAGEFGHLFYGEKLSHYRLRIEYRFVGEQVPGGPDWAVRNSGIMIHCEDPQKMPVDQDFPISVEVQLLGGLGSGQRSTANLCTPGTNVVIDDKLETAHCISSSSRTYRGDQWVTVEVEVRGSQLVKHIMDGEVVLEYSLPQLDDRDPRARQRAARQGRLLKDGYIAIQAESHPVEFRRIELWNLTE